MKPVHADFKRPWVPPRWMWWAVAALALIACAAVGMAWRAWKQVDVQRAALRDAVAATQAAAVVPAPLRVLRPYDASAREMWAEHSAPWPQALTMIEATAIIGVTPVALEFVASDKAVRVEVSFTDYAKLLEYVDALNAGEPELKWALVQSQAQASGEATAVIVSRVVRR